MYHRNVLWVLQKLRALERTLQIFFEQHKQQFQIKVCQNNNGPSTLSFNGISDIVNCNVVITKFE